MNKTVNVRPTTSSSKLDGGKRKTVIVTVAVVAVLTVIGGGCLGWNAYENLGWMRLARTVRPLQGHYVWS